MIRTALFLIALTSPFPAQSAAEPALMWQGNQAVETAVLQSVPVKQLPLEQQNTFETVNDISLQDTKSELLSKKGYPQETREDWVLGSKEYIYDDMVAGIIDGEIAYVQVKKSASYLKVNETYMDLTLWSISRTLGDPDYVSEDGLVFVKGHQALKIYLDENQSLKQVEFFDEISF